MAALSLGQRKDVKSFIAAFAGSQRYIMDYLIEEVLKRQSADVQDFLLQTSVLERLTPPLCNYLTGRSDSQDMLSKLERANLFLIPLDESGQWYRYHHLFAELLRHRLEVVHGAEEMPLLHQRASQWYEDNNCPDDVIHHALAARDWERAMRLIYDQCGARMNRGEFNTLLSWLQVVPDEVLRTHPRLYSQYAYVLISRGQLEAAEAALSHLEITTQGDANLQGELAVCRMSLARQRGDVPRIEEFAERALALLPPDAFALRARASFLLGTVQLNKARLEEALSLMTDAHELGRQAGDYFIAAGGAGYLGTILWLRGRLRQALDMGQQAVELGGPSLVAATPRWTLATVLYERNDLAGAARSAQLAVEMGEFSGLTEARVPAYFCLAQKLLSQGDAAGANAEMEKADQAVSYPNVPPTGWARHAANRVMFAIQQDDVTAALDWGNRLSAYPEDTLAVWLQHVPARLLIARGEKTAAAAQLQGLYERAVQANAQGFVIKIRVYQALAAPTPDEALTFLAEALTLGQPEGFIRSFVDEGRLLAPLLRQALAHGIMPEYTGKLLDIIQAEERQRQARNAQGAPASQSSEILSERELEVLRLVAEGLSNQQIADRLFISLSTAKNHVHNILEKLNVQGRTQAVAQARELKLI